MKRLVVSKTEKVWDRRGWLQFKLLAVQQKQLDFQDSGKRGLQGLTNLDAALCPYPTTSKFGSRFKFFEAKQLRKKLGGWHCWTGA
jgi:hypothetical protein